MKKFKEMSDTKKHNGHPGRAADNLNLLSGKVINDKNIAGTVIETEQGDKYTLTGYKFLYETVSALHERLCCRVFLCQNEKNEDALLFYEVYGGYMTLIEDEDWYMIPLKKGDADILKNSEDDSQWLNYLYETEPEDGVYKHMKIILQNDNTEKLLLGLF